MSEDKVLTNDDNDLSKHSEDNFESLLDKLRKLKEIGNVHIDKMKKFADLEHVLASHNKDEADVQLLDGQD